MAKKKYYVGIREVHVSTRLVEADTSEQAKEIAGEGDSEEIKLEYSHTLDQDTWTVEEATNRQPTDTLPVQ